LYQLLEVATMNKPKLQLVDLTFDVAFEAMRDNDMARKSAFASDAEVDAFVAGLDSCFDDEIVLTDADIEVVAA
jgi:hypothetical protein